MGIGVRCPSCDKDYEVRASFAGRTIPCRNCGAIFPVPRAVNSDGTVEIVEFEPVADDYDAYRPQRPVATPTRPITNPRRPAPQTARPSSARPAVKSREPVARTRAVRAGRRKKPLKTLAIFMCVLAGISAVGASSLLIYTFVIKTKTNAAGDPVDPEDGFGMKKLRTPSFPRLPAPQVHRASGANIYFVDLARQSDNGSGPGERMTMRIYVPGGHHARRSLGCVLVAPAGTTLLHGNKVGEDSYHAETLPYVKAGYAVVLYSIDGALSNQRTATIAETATAYDKFRAAKAGVLNGRNALEFVLSRLRQVDPDRIYCAGHSSAGTLSLLLAAHERRISGCIAYAPATDVEKRLKAVLDDASHREALSGLPDFLKRSSPKTHVDKLKCPVFIHHSRDDGNEPFASTESFVEQLRNAKKAVEFSVTDVGGHYDSMIAPGISRAIAWLKNLPAELAAPPVAQPPLPRDPPRSVRPRFPRNVRRRVRIPRNGLAPVRFPGPAIAFYVTRFTGRGDPQTAARRALARIKWIDARSVIYDRRLRRIVARVTARSFNSSSARLALSREGFSIRLTRYSSRGL